MIVTLMSHLLNKYKETKPAAEALAAAQQFCEWAETALQATPPVVSYGASPGYRVVLRDNTTVYLSRQYVQDAFGAELPPAHAVGMAVGGSRDSLPATEAYDLFSDRPASGRLGVAEGG